MSKTHKPYSEMNTRELAVATRQYNQDMPRLPGRPLTAAQEKLHRDAAKAAAREASAKAG